MKDETLGHVQTWLKEHADCAGHEFDLCALVDSAILAAATAPKAETPKKVFILAYNHKHGEDLSVYDTAEHATLSACDIIEEYIEDVEDVVVRAAIKLAILECDWDKALELWSKDQYEATGFGEDITIYEKEVLGGE